MKATDGLFGPVTGKLGKIIASSWKGIPYFKLAPDYSKMKVRTPAQLAHTAKFNFVSQFLVPFHPYLNIGFKELAVKKTEISAAFSIAFKYAVLGAHPDLTIDYSKFEISRGTLPMMKGIVMEHAAEDTLILTWLQNLNRQANFNDQVMLAVYCPELHLCDGFTGGVKRSDNGFTFKYHPMFVGKPLEVYLCVTTITQNLASNSVYLGRLTPEL